MPSLFSRRREALEHLINSMKIIRGNFVFLKSIVLIMTMTGRMLRFDKYLSGKIKRTLILE